MSNFYFGNTTSDYLNQNVHFNYTVSNGDTQTALLVTEYNKIQTILLNNLKTEMEQNDQIMKNDMSQVLQKHDNNKTAIYAKYSQLLKNLFARLKEKSNTMNTV